MFKIGAKEAELLDVNALKPIYQLSIDRFEECASESESITEKSIKVLISVASLGAFWVGIGLNHKINICLVIIIGFFYIVEVVMLFLLILPRNVYHRGLKPETAYPKDLHEERKNEQEIVVYQNLINTISQKIEDFYTVMHRRKILYTVALVSALVLLIVTALLLGLFI